MDSSNHANQTKKLCGTKDGLITSELLDVFLYGKRKIQGIDLENAKRQKVGQGKCVKPLKCE
jgi:retron-type reverse transcriptase